jgi:hypothetical protein
MRNIQLFYLLRIYKYANIYNAQLLYTVQYILTKAIETAWVHYSTGLKGQVGHAFLSFQSSTNHVPLTPLLQLIGQDADQTGSLAFVLYVLQKSRNVCLPRGERSRVNPQVASRLTQMCNLAFLYII